MKTLLISKIMEYAGRACGKRMQEAIIVTLSEALSRGSDSVLSLTSHLNITLKITQYLVGFAKAL